MDEGNDWIRGQDRTPGAAATTAVGGLALAGAVGGFAAGGSVWPFLVGIGGALTLLVGIVGLFTARAQRRRAYRVIGPGAGSLEVTDQGAGTRSHPLDTLVRIEGTTGNRPADRWWTLTFRGGADVKIQGEPGQRVMSLVRQRRPDVELVVRPLGDGGSGAP